MDKKQKFMERHKGVKIMLIVFGVVIVSLIGLLLLIFSSLPSRRTIQKRLRWAAI